ncbi:probable flavin-containing monooxygenase 1 [Andrographis paniculata]|uniref:probable flavin-containing monooxygenase 1 n=1 Tax=Andrographis paniculata TaxID=175694 RepID=UPI0021E6E02B|nr:probable flavin-containing monooxygenase 1 [Andrographis paniculata]
MNNSTSRRAWRPEKIAIIGAGISGLLACKHVIEKGFEPVVFEARNDVGGVWSCTIESTKLQNPKGYFQFSDFPWPSSVEETFPDHNQVLDYLKSYALHFDLIPFIKFNSRVLAIDYMSDDDLDMRSNWYLWGGTGAAFSPKGKWNVVVEDALHPLNPPKVYKVDFVLLCIGRFSDLPYMPEFWRGEGQVSEEMLKFNGVVIHSMDYAAMDRIEARKLVENKRVAIVGFQKSALDIAVELAQLNGVKNPCTLVLRRAHWSGPENLVRFSFRHFNRFSEFMVHKPTQGLLLCFLVFILSPLRWIFSKMAEWYLRWIYPLKKYDIVPTHSFLEQIYSCRFMVMPDQFYRKVQEGSLLLRKSRVSALSGDSLVLADGKPPVSADVVILATGYKSDEKIANMFTSVHFKKCIMGSSSPFYRECIHPRIPQLAIMGYSESPATIFTFEMRVKWVAHFLAGKFRLPAVAAMEEEGRKWEENARRYSGGSYKRSCVGVMLQIYCNDEICRDIGCSPMRKKWFLPELFTCYHPHDYANV